MKALKGFENGIESGGIEFAADASLRIGTFIYVLLNVLVGIVCLREVNEYQLLILLMMVLYLTLAPFRLKLCR